MSLTAVPIGPAEGTDKKKAPQGASTERSRKKKGPTHESTTH